MYKFCSLLFLFLFSSFGLCEQKEYFTVEYALGNTETMEVVHIEKLKKIIRDNPEFWCENEQGVYDKRGRAYVVAECSLRTEDDPADQKWAIRGTAWNYYAKHQSEKGLELRRSYLMEYNYKMLNNKSQSDH